MLRTAQAHAAWAMFSKIAQARASFTLQWYFDRPQTCLGRYVCPQALIG